MQEKLNWLRLARSENIGKSTFFRLIEIFGSVENALARVKDYAKEGGLRREIKIISVRQAEEELKNTTKFGAEIILFSDSNYPKLLREISDPPPVLTIKGNKDFLNRDAIAIVGPRNASYNAIAFAKKIALELGQNSLITVSGMARGVDAAAHEASILSGTIGVIAGGINNIYPKQNTNLFKEVLDRGLLISENYFGAPPKGGNFVQRNRIIAGLSFGVVVVEAGLRSGSLITAKFAINQGREVFAVPGSPFDPRCQGANRLIKDGAKMVEDIDDILEELSDLRLRFGNVKTLREPEFEEFISPQAKMPLDDDIRKVRDEILARLSFSPTSINQIIEETSMPIRVINIALVQLELAEKIIIDAGGIYLNIS